MSNPFNGLGFDLVRVTESAALAAAHWMGSGNIDATNRAATVAMTENLTRLNITGKIAVGEETRLGEHTPLDTGQLVGNGTGIALDVLVDPIDGRRLVAQGLSGALSVACLTPQGSIWSPPHAVYMEKIIVDREVGESLVEECLDAPAAWTLALIARLKGKAVKDLDVFVLDRPRHKALVQEIRAAGARVLLQPDGEITGAILAADSKSSVDVLMGVGGVSEALMGACVVRTLQGKMLARLAPQSAIEKQTVLEGGQKLDTIYTHLQLVREKAFFVATGITDGLLLPGVRVRGSVAETTTLLLGGSLFSRRQIWSEHTWE